MLSQTVQKLWSTWFGDAQDFFKLKELPCEMIGEICAFLDSKSIILLYTSGCKRLQKLLLGKNVVRSLRCFGWSYLAEDIPQKCPYIDRFRSLQSLLISVYSPYHYVYASMLDLNLADLPPTLLSLNLYARNANCLLFSPISTEDNPIFHNLQEILPSLRDICLEGHEPAPFPHISSISWPVTLTELSLPDSGVSHNDLLNLPNHIEKLRVSWIDYDSSKNSPLPSSLRTLSVKLSWSLMERGMPKVSILDQFDTLPHTLTTLKVRLRRPILNLSLTQLPASLTSLDISESTFFESHLPSLPMLTFLRCAPNNETLRTTFLPRSLLHIQFTRFPRLDLESWKELPPNLESIEALDEEGEDYCVVPVGGLNARDALPFLPKNLTEINMKQIQLTLGAEDASHISKKVRRLHLHEMNQSGLEGLPTSLTHLSVTKADLSFHWVTSIPRSLLVLIIQQANFVDENAFANLPKSLQELKLQKANSFSQSMASYLPITLQGLHITCEARFDDSLVKLLNTPNLLRLFIDSPHAMFTENIIYLLPKQLQLLSLRGCDDWTLSPAALQSLPKSLTQCMIFNRDNSPKTKSSDEIRPYVPKNLLHNLSVPRR